MNIPSYKILQSCTSLGLWRKRMKVNENDLKTQIATELYWFKVYLIEKCCIKSVNTELQ